jgi:rod shape-determining protein MreD
LITQSSASLTRGIRIGTTVRFLGVIVAVLFFQFGAQYLVRYYVPVPHLLALLVIFVGLQWEESRGAVLGFTLGMLYGLLAYEPPGLSAFGLTLIGFLSGLLKSHFFIDTYLDKTIFAFFLVVLHNTAVVLVAWITLGLHLPLNLVQCVLTAVCAAPCLAFFAWVIQTREK